MEALLDLIQDVCWVWMFFVWFLFSLGPAGVRAQIALWQVLFRKARFWHFDDFSSRKPYSLLVYPAFMCVIHLYDCLFWLCSRSLWLLNVRGSRNVFKQSDVCLYSVVKKKITYVHWILIPNANSDMQTCCSKAYMKEHPHNVACSNTANQEAG